MAFALQRSWGADPLPGGSARFRLWAPDETALKLRPEGGEDLPMQAGEDGWWSVETDAVPVGGAYAFVLDDGTAVPDPAAREQAGDVHGPSRLVDPRAYAWRTKDWAGRPWEETILYELHVGTFTQAGTFEGVIEKLDYLADLGVTAVELMPVAQFAGERGWGYDGVLFYAPHAAYGGADGLKRLVDAAHERGLMVFLDVVYNHFGPDGNYLHAYAHDFFDAEEETPWGAAIAFERDPVRRFFVENPLYWIEEYRIDGLRFDAIDQIDDQSESEPILEEMARAIRDRFPDRHVHLCTEDDRNITRLHERGEDGSVPLFTAEWNDDFHHVAHVAATGETEGYYIDFAHGHTEKMANALATGFVYQGERSEHLGHERGTSSAHQPPAALVNFIQNHDQIGNRAFGERLFDLAPRRAVEALSEILLLSPQIPLLFMGEEWAERRPFAFFTDFHGELADAVREGRRNEFQYWSGVRDPHQRELIPDPNALRTFEDSRPDWRLMEEPDHARQLDLTRRLLAIRREEIVPLIPRIGGNSGEARIFEGGAFAVTWTADGGAKLRLAANIDDEPWALPEPPAGRVLFESEEDLARALESGEPLPGWSVLATREDAS